MKRNPGKSVTVQIRGFQEGEEPFPALVSADHKNNYPPVFVHKIFVFPNFLAYNRAYRNRAFDSDKKRMLLAPSI